MKEQRFEKVVKYDWNEFQVFLLAIVGFIFFFILGFINFIIGKYELSSIQFIIATLIIIINIALELSNIRKVTWRRIK